MTLLALLALAGLLLAWQPTRRPSRGTRHPRGEWRARLTAAARARVSVPLALLHGRGRRSGSPDVAVVISEVATRLRSGAAVEHAWSAAVDRALGAPAGSAFGRRAPGVRATGSHPAEPPTDLADVLPAGLVRLAERCRGDPAAEAAVRAVMAATRLSRTTGAPLAGVLDRCVETVVEAERAHDARSIALAGPRSTARILTGLPLLGLLLGAGLGADPLATALDGGWGTASVACGIILLYAGARWSTALVRAAHDPTARPDRRERPSGRTRPGAGRHGLRRRAREAP